MSTNETLAESVSTAFVWNHTLFIVSTLLTGMASWLIAVFLGPTHYGVYTATLAFVALATLFISFGYEGALNIYLARLRKDSQRTRFLVRHMSVRRVTLVSSICILGYLVSLLWGYEWIPGLREVGRYFPLALACGGVSLISSLFIRILETLFRIKPLAAIRVTRLTAALIAYAIVLLLGLGIEAVLWVLLTTSALALALFLFACRDLMLGASEKFPTDEVYRLGRTLWASDLVSSFLGRNVDIVVMSFYGVAASHIGFYNIVFLLVQYTRLMANRGLSGVLQSAFSSAFHEGGVPRLSRWWRLTLKFQILVASPGVLLLALVAPGIFTSLLPDYADATGMLQIFSGFMFGVALIGGGVHVTALYAMNKQRNVLWLRLSAGLINLVLDVILIYLWGAVGALVATGVSMFVIGVVELRLTRMVLDVGYPVSFCLKCCSCMAVSGVLCRLVPITGWAGLLFSGTVFFLTYVFLVFWVKPLDTEDVKNVSGVNYRLGSVLSRFAGQPFE